MSRIYLDSWRGYSGYNSAFDNNELWFLFLFFFEIYKLLSVVSIVSDGI